jgi:hypothetical protein
MRLRFVYPMLRRCLWMAVLLYGFHQATPALADGQIINGKAPYTFGGTITFQAQILSDTPIQSVILTIRSQGDPDTQVETLVPDYQGNLVYVYRLSSERPLRAFAKVDYQFSATSQDGVEIKSPMYSFTYEDNRFDWHKLDMKPFSVHWYEGDQAFAQRVLDVAQQGLQHIQGILPLQTPSQVDIYVYATANEMQETLLLAGQNWAAGHADPDLAVMVVALPVGPDQLLLTEERIPHELMHIMLYQSNPGAYDKLPAWFNEGLASISELVPNPDYQVLLETASKKGTLIPIASLCRGFPVDISGAQVSYAEATAFTRYLYRQYGSSSLQTLIGSYANGLECSRGMDVSLKISLAQVDSNWRATIFGSPPANPLSGAVWSWFVLLGVVLAIPLILTILGLRKRTPGELTGR